jgi:hypothetical protein
VVGVKLLLMVQNSIVMSILIPKPKLMAQGR